MKPLLQLAPHELEPSRRADDDLKPNEREFEFRGRWQGREHDFLVRITSLSLLPVFFFAFKRQRQRGNFVYFPKNDYPGMPEGQELPFLLRKFDMENRSEDWRKSAQKDLQTCCERPWGRVWHLDEDWNIAGEKPAQRRLFLAFEGWGDLHVINTYPEELLFRWAPLLTVEGLAALPHAHLLDLFLSELLDTQSDAAFVARFAQLDNDARRKLCCPLRRGTYEEWRKLATLFVQSRITCWQSETDDISYEFWGSEWRPAGMYLYNRGLLHPIPIKFQKFTKWMIDYFEPTEDSNILSHWTAKRWLPDAKSVKVRVAPPNFHEQIEASVRLREWLRGKASPSEIEALLRE